MNQAASRLATGKVLQGVVQNGRLLQEEGWVRELLEKAKKGLFLSKDTFFLGGRELQGFFSCRCIFFLRGMERAYLIDYLTGV